MSELPVCVDKKGSRHVCVRDVEIGELVVDVVIEPIEDVGALIEDCGCMRVGVPVGGARSVGEIVTEETTSLREGESSWVVYY
jgi:hypothetical protein